MPQLSKRYNPAEPRGAHGEWVSLGTVSASDIRFTDGKLKHGPSGLVIATAAHEKIAPGTVKHTVSHADGTQVYSGTSKKAALQAVAAHHNSLPQVSTNAAPQVQARHKFAISQPNAAYIADRIHITGMSADDARNAHNAVDSTRVALALSARLAPAAVSRINSITFVHDIPGHGQHRLTPGTSDIMLHTALLRHPDRVDAVFRDHINSGEYAPISQRNMDPIRYSVTHETGHAVAAHAFGNTSASTVSELWQILGNAMKLKQPPDGGWSAMAWLNAPGNRKRAEKAVSAYGASKPAELLAELWTEYVLSTSPRFPAQVYGNYVLTRMRRDGRLLVPGVTPV